MEILVFSGQFYRRSRTQKGSLDDAGPHRLWRIRPDGHGLAPLTDTRHDLRAPTLTPDGKALLVSDAKARVWQLPVQGGALKPMPQAFAGTFSPDGRHIATIDEDDVQNYRLILTDAATRKRRVVDHVGDFAWSPDSRRLFLRREGSRGAVLEIATLRETPAPGIDNPTWLADGSVLGDNHNAEEYPITPLLWRPAQAEPERLPLKGAPERVWSDGVGLFLVRCRRWLPLPGQPHRFVAESWGSMSGGTRYSCALVDLTAKRFRRLIDGRLVGISSDGRRIAAARDEWVDKRAGRRGGPLEIVDLETGACRAITDRLVAIEGGVWLP